MSASNIIKNDFLKTFIPITITMFSMFMYNIIDSYFISKIGEEALAGFGLITPFVLFTIILFNSIASAVSIHVGKAFGANSFNKIRKKLLVGFVISFSFSVFVFLAFFLMSDTIADSYQTTEQIKIHFSEYYTYWVWTLLLNGVISVYSFSLNATGQAKTDTLINIFALMTNLVLDYVLIFGFGETIPALGLAGASLATLVAKILQISILIYVFKRKNLIIFKTTKSHFFAIFRKIKKLTIPLALQGVIIPSGIFIFAIMVSKFPTSEIAAWTLFMRFESLVFIVAAAANTSLGVLVSKYYGRKDHKSIPLALILANKTVFFWTFILTVFFFLFGEEVGKLFLTDQKTIETFHFATVLGFGSYFLGSVIGNINKLFTVLNRPYIALSIPIVRISTAVIILPFTFQLWFGFDGLFYGFLAGGVVSLVFALHLFKTQIKHYQNIPFKTVL